MTNTGNADARGGGNVAEQPAEDPVVAETAAAASKKEVSLEKLVLSIAAYCAASLAVVYFNWWLFTSGFKFPVFISWLQQVIGFGIFSLGSSIALYFQKLRPVFPAPAFRSDVTRKVLPLSASFVLTVASANLCLQKTQISTYQVARSLTLFFILILSYFILKERQTPLVLIACALMVVGFVINSLDPATLSFYGLLFGALSSFFQALYNVLIKFTLPAVANDNQMLLYYNVMLSSFLFLPVVFICEGIEPFYQSLNAAENSMLAVWGGIAVSGFLGTALNMTQYLLISATTPLSFNIIGLAKSLVQSLGGIVLVGDRVTVESLLGIGLSTIGSAVYVKAKNDQAISNRQAAAAFQDAEAQGAQDAAIEIKFIEAPSVAPMNMAATPSTVFDMSPGRR